MLFSDLLKSFRSTDAKPMLTPKLTLITLSFPHLSAGTAFHTHEKKLNLYLVSLQPPNYSPLSYGNPFYIHYKLFFVSSSSLLDLGQSCPWQFLVPCLISPHLISEILVYMFVDFHLINSLFFHHQCHKTMECHCHGFYCILLKHVEVLTISTCECDLIRK